MQHISAVNSSACAPPAVIFTREEICEAVRLAHAQGKKIYVTVNVFPHNEDLVSLPDYLRFLADASVDAVLVADLGAFMLAREAAPHLPVHISTQANNVKLADGAGVAGTWCRAGGACP